MTLQTMSEDEDNSQLARYASTAMERIASTLNDGASESAEAFELALSRNCCVLILLRFCRA